MPDLFILAGPNGAGKTTSAQVLLPELFHCREFVNADSIAAGLSPFNVEGVAIKAGRLMLSRIDELLKARADFAFETTLASLSFVPLLQRASQLGYSIRLIFLWLESEHLAQERVKMRVSRGGHSIPPDVIARRYQRGLKNFFERYQPLVTSWHFYDNTDVPTLVALGTAREQSILNEKLWQKITAI